MVIANTKKFFAGSMLMATFIAALVVIFLPIFGGMNGLDYMDSVYNSISKGSAYYIPKLKEKSDRRHGTAVSLALALRDEKVAAETRLLFEQAGASVRAESAQLQVEGDLGAILARCLADSDEMYANNGAAVRQRYGYDERRALYNWWQAMRAMDKELKKQERFPEAALIHEVETKAVECAYNYYTIEPNKITDKLGLVLFSLVFYIVYTVWYGFAVILMFEGWGLRLSH